MKIVTFNLRFKWLGDGINSFIHRSGMIMHKIDTVEPDVICFQETTSENAGFLKRHMSDYEFHFFPREEGLSGEGLTIATRKDSISLLNLNCFWLSPQPNVPASKFPKQGNNSRIVFWAMLRSISDGKLFRVYNIHLEHIWADVRREQIALVIDQMKKDMASMPTPCFLMGDFNAEPTEAAIDYCLNNPIFPLVNVTPDLGATFHGFGSYSDCPQSDYIFADPETAKLPIKVNLWQDTEDGIFLSDHYPVEIEIELK